MPRPATPPRRHVVCDVAELPPGARTIVNVSGRSVGVFNVDGELKAVRNVCPHHGAPLCLGDVTGTMLPSAPGEYVWGMRNGVLRCPWHGYEFDLETGRTLYDRDDLRVKVYAVYAESGKVVLEM
jgi:3-phenylpropionate/trans-cinnamate dioxygenase ferredoxin subunit